MYCSGMSAIEELSRKFMYSTAWSHMHIGCGFHEVGAWAVHKICPCIHLGKNERSTRWNRDETYSRESRVLQ